MHMHVRDWGQLYTAALSRFAVHAVVFWQLKYGYRLCDIRFKHRFYFYFKRPNDSKRTHYNVLQIHICDVPKPPCVNVQTKLPKEQ